MELQKSPAGIVVRTVDSGNRLKRPYHWVKKTFELAESFIKGEDCLVYVMGTLYGENRHGVSFSNIRYIDRFVIRDSLIAQQDVWNDLSESGVLDRTAD